MKRTLLAAALLMMASAAAGPKVAITFDDLPAHGQLPPGVTRVEIAKDLIVALKAAGIPATVGFVNGALIDKEPEASAVLSLWHESGNLLGNHTWSHPGLSKLDNAAFEAEIVRNEPLIAKASGTADWHWFRYPFLDEGKDEAQRSAIRTFLVGRGYRIGHVTVSLNDWDYPAPYARCLVKKDAASVARLEEMYLKRAEEGLAYSRALSTQLYGREIPYVQLLHIGAFQVHMMPKLIALYKSKGVEFVSLQEALQDPAYKAYADPSEPAPAARDMTAEAAKRGLPLPAVPLNRNGELNTFCP